jgi:hypothetical protein
MGQRSIRWGMLAAAMAVSSTPGVFARPPLPVAADRIWLAPDPGTPDFVRLFDHPEEWTRAREIVRVFKFYHQHTQTPPPRIVGPNTFDALVRADAFRKVRRFGMKTAMEIGSVKEFYCTSDSTGMDESIRSTTEAVSRIRSAGGDLQYLAMDEPWVAGRARICGGPALEPTADRVAVYMSAVQRAFPPLRIGLIEAYPFSNADSIERIVRLMQARGVAPAFLHMDVDWHALRPGEFQRDMSRLRSFAASEKIPFGIIVVGYNGDADPLYAVDAAGITELIADTFQTWDAMPEQIVFQSWVVSSTGLLITPSNLPEDRLYTHTNLVLQLFRRLRGGTGGAVGTAIRRVPR